MLDFVVKRVLLLIPLLLSVTLVCFILVKLNPSDPAEVTLRINNTVTITPKAIAQTKKELGLDKPLSEQYFLWLKKLVHGDLGFSYTNKTAVLDEILEAIPTTFYLSLCSLILIIIFGFGLGVLCAIYENSYFDKVIRALVFTSSSFPSFWLALLLIWFFSIHFNFFPSNGLEKVSGIVLPSIVLAITYISTFVRIIRNSMIQIRDSVFITYAKARAISKYRILKHQIINIINPFITALAMCIPKLFAGTVIIENIFALPGLGRLCIEAIFARDFPVIQSYVLFIAILFIVFNFISDIWLYARDMRIKQ